MRTLIFVCTGNTCRSPMAEFLYKAYLQSIGEESIRALSRGLAAEGAPMAQNAVTALGEIGIAAENHISSNLTRDEAEGADLLCVMSAGHKAALVSAGISEDKIICLDIFDPYGGNMENYRICLEQIAAGLNQVSLRLFGYYIAAFTEPDAKSIDDLETQCFSEPWSEQGLLDSHHNGTDFFVAKTENEIVGYAGVQLVAGIGYVTNIAVDEKYRGRGIGRALTVRLCTACSARGAESITLEVRPSNTAAVSLYGKLGFAEVGRRRDFYRAPKEDALLLTKNFLGDNQC